MVETDFSSIWDQVSKLPWCVLVSTGRTGGVAFNCQLDGHPEIIVFSNVVYFHNWWEQSFIAQQPGEIDISDLVNQFIWQNIEVIKTRYDWVEQTGKLGPNRDQEVPLNLEKFHANAVGLMEGREITPKNFLISLYAAYALTLGQDISQKKVFFYHLHHVWKLPTYLADFPKSKIIVTTRDPRATYVSGVLHWRAFQAVADNPSFPQRVLSRVVDEGMKLMENNSERVKMMRLEDLDNPETMNAVCQWLEVKYHPCLENATIAGLRWWGDLLSEGNTSKEMSEEEYVKSIRKSNWEEVLSSVDKFVLRVILDPQLRKFEYIPDEKLEVWKFLVAFFAIPLVTGFEARYWRFSYLKSTILRGRFKDFVRVFYHYLRRVRYFFQLLGRSICGYYYPLTMFRPVSFKDTQR